MGITVTVAVVSLILIVVVEVIFRPRHRRINRVTVVYVCSHKDRPNTKQEHRLSRSSDSQR